MRHLLILALFAAPPGVAMAQTSEPPAAAKPEGVGAWDLSDPTGTHHCPVTLKDGRAGQPRPLDAAGCREVIPVMAAVAGWNNPRRGELRFVDKAGTILFSFIEVEEGMYEAIRPDGSFLLATAAVAHASVSIEDTVGEWLVRRAGAQLCALSLTADKRDGGTMALATKPDCAQEIAIFNWIGWKLERNTLVLQSRRGDTFKLAPTADGGWRAPGPPSDAIVLARPQKE